MQPGSAGEIIAKLENAGHIIRVTSEKDRRTMDIVLTEQGRELAEAFKEQRRSRHEEMFSCLSDDEIKCLLSLLEKINVDWDKRYHNIREEHRHGDRHHHMGHDHHCGKEH